MPLNADARLVLDLMDDVGAPPLDSLPPAEAREARNQMVPPIVDPCDRMRDVDAGGVPARLYLPHPGDGLTGLLIWFHGGGWVLGSVDGHDNEGTVDDPRVSPLLADDEVLRSARPAFVVTAGFDPLRDEGVAYADRLAELGVRTNHLHCPGQIHAFFSLPHVIRDARSAHAAAAQALADAFA